MTFFNKKTEVMQIEMTPYGRYLYSIGKFKPHSYEFVDDDVIYRAPGSSEAQESAHNRILNETPKLKINRAFQDEAQQIEPPAIITRQRVMNKTMNLRQPNLYPLGRSSYSSDNMPTLQASMLQGTISGSQMSYQFSASQSPPGTGSFGGSILIPQVDIDFRFVAILKNELDPIDEYDGESVRSTTFQNGNYVEVRYREPIIHLKEFNSFYEKENFEIEVFKVSGSLGEQTLAPLKMNKQFSSIINNILVDNQSMPDYANEEADFEAVDQGDNSRTEYYFDIEVDNEISPEILCKAVDSLEINSQFLDEELICPDQRTDRFDIYATRVGPEDLEDCD